jgi:hypothetical protein
MQKIKSKSSLHDIAWMAKPITMQGVGKTQAYLHFTEKIEVDRMQAQETLLGCLQCLESENREEGLALKLLDASLSLYGPNICKNPL